MPKKRTDASKRSRSIAKKSAAKKALGRKSFKQPLKVMTQNPAPRDPPREKKPEDDTDDD